MNDILRIICIAVLCYSLLVLWQKWEKWPQNGEVAVSPSSPLVSTPEDADSPPAVSQNFGDVSESAPAASPIGGGGEIIVAETDWMWATIDANGGNIVSLRLKNHTEENGDYYPLFEDGIRRHGAQNGLIGGEFPDHRTTFRFIEATPTVTLSAGQDSITVAMLAESGGVRLEKRYIFSRGDYMIRIELDAENTGNEPVSPQGYFQLRHNGWVSENESSFLPSFFGAAVFTDSEKFQKIDYSDIGNTAFPRRTADGWIGFIQRYFAAVWLPEAGVEREYFMRAPSGGDARIGVIVPYAEIAPGQKRKLAVNLFAAAQEQEILNQLNESGAAPGIHLVVDYGWLTFIAVLLFKLLALVQGFAQNWGLSVILLTFLIKLAFYPLSSVSYRSIARMKDLAPRIKDLQEIHKGDKQQMQQAMMAMYKEHKINPLGGCLPVLLQIPVFIALYWVILGSVELRQAPFYGWITDLSAPDPYFILPIMMGGAMFAQTKLSPTPPDPTQAMIIRILPLFFTIFSLFFPSGLVLYWLVNTLLSIAQQWHITRAIARAKGGG